MNMDIRLDESIRDIINENYSISPEVFIGIEQRRQVAESTNSSINEILKESPTTPTPPEQTDDVPTQIVNDLNYEHELKERELNSILELLSLLDVSIDKKIEFVKKIDGKIISLVKEINDAIDVVKSLYDERITVGCRSNLIWKNIGTTTGYTPDTGAGTTYSNYTVVKNPEDEIIKNYYGLKYYEKPSNRDYGSTIISEFNGKISTGSSILTVISVGGTEGISLGDQITDNLTSPIAFNVGNLPTVIGFGTTSSIGVNTSLMGNVKESSNIIAHTGIGTTTDISINDYVINSGVFDSDTKVVGFGTTVTSITYYNIGLSTVTTLNLVVPSVILNKVSISSVTNGMFGFGTSIQYKSLLLDETSNISTDEEVFTAIRVNDDITQNFDYSNSPIDPITIGIINEKRTGKGYDIKIVNNGASSGPSQWRKSLDAPEPNIGAGFVKYYNGRGLWPYVSIVGYASEGYVYSFPENISPTYIEVSPVGLGSTSAVCTVYDSNIIAAENNLENIINKNIGEIQKLISASIPIRNYIDNNQLKAWSYLQSSSYIRGELNTLSENINSLNSFDYNSL